MDFRNTFLANFLVGILAICFLGGYQWYGNTYLLRKFNVTNEKMLKDMEGRQVQISHGQIWPFDNGQGMTLSVVHKKQVENFVVVVIDVKAAAVVDQPKDQKDKAKLPTRVNVAGHLKLTYELFGSDWYLVNVDALTAKASAQFDQ